MDILYFALFVLFVFSGICAIVVVANKQNEPKYTVFKAVQENMTVEAVTDKDGNWKEVLYYSNPAKTVIRIDNFGMSISETGKDGPYTMTWGAQEDIYEFLERWRNK